MSFQLELTWEGKDVTKRYCTLLIWTDATFITAITFVLTDNQAAAELKQ